MADPPIMARESLQCRWSDLLFAVVVNAAAISGRLRAGWNPKRMRTLELTAGLHFPLQSDEGPHRHAAPADRTSPLQVRLRSAQRLLAESDSPAGSDDSVHGTTRRIVGEGFAIDAGRIRADRKWKPSSSGRGI